MIAVLPAVTPTAVPLFVSSFEGVVARKTGTYSTVSRWLKIKNSNYTQSERRHELFESCKAKPPRRFRLCQGNRRNGLCRWHDGRNTEQQTRTKQRPTTRLGVQRLRPSAFDDEPECQSKLPELCEESEVGDQILVLRRQEACENENPRPTLKILGWGTLRVIVIYQWAHRGSAFFFGFVIVYEPQK